MTCRELRLYFEDPLRSDAEFPIEAEHLLHCTECAGFVEGQRQLGAGLRRIREGVPQFPGTLDATVLANYRRDVNRRSYPTAANARRRIAILCASSAAAAMILVAVLVYFARPRAASRISEPFGSRSVATSQPVVGISTANLSGPAKIRRSHLRRGRSTPSPTTSETSLPSGFRSLMYCDELSCGGVMEVIRVQLPSSGGGLGPASTPASGTVIADVLVGPDGIARGIRVVE
jgi:hypothetical protein